MTHPRSLGFRLFAAAAFAVAVSGLGIIVASDALAGELPAEVKKPAAAAEKPKQSPAPKPKPVAKKKRIDYGKYEGY